MGWREMARDGRKSYEATYVSKIRVAPAQYNIRYIVGILLGYYSRRKFRSQTSDNMDR